MYPSEPVSMLNIAVEVVFIPGFAPHGMILSVTEKLITKKPLKYSTLSRY